MTEDDDSSKLALQCLARTLLIALAPFTPDVHKLVNDTQMSEKIEKMREKVSCRSYWSAIGDRDKIHGDFMKLYKEIYGQRFDLTTMRLVSSQFPPEISDLFDELKRLGGISRADASKFLEDLGGTSDKWYPTLRAIAIGEWIQPAG